MLLVLLLEIQLMNLGGLRRVELRLFLVLTFLTTFFIEDFDVNFLTNELVSTFFITEDRKILQRP